MSQRKWFLAKNALEALEIGLAEARLPTTEVHLAAARYYATLRDYGKASSEYNLALTQDPGNGGAWAELGALWEGAGRMAPALEAYRQANVVMPGNAGVLAAIDRLTSTDPDDPLRLGAASMSTSRPTGPVPAVVGRVARRAVELARRPLRSPRSSRRFARSGSLLLLAAICLEGLGRRYLPAIPSAVFYFLKDVVLLVGLIRFRINRDGEETFSVPLRRLRAVSQAGHALDLRRDHQSRPEVDCRSGCWVFAPIGSGGSRRWLSPACLLDPVVRRKVVVLQSAVTMIVAVLAICSSARQSTMPSNTYSIVDGEESLAIRDRQHGTSARLVDLLVHLGLRRLRGPRPGACCSRSASAKRIARRASRRSIAHALRGGGAPDVGLAGALRAQPGPLRDGGVAGGVDASPASVVA